MTLVFRTPLGSLIQSQVGTADIVNLLSAAHSTYGWLGGLDGARFLLSKIPNTFSKRIKELQLDKNLRLSPLTVNVFTAGGPLICSIDNAHEAFGGDVRTQLIGLTLCALAHETNEADAVALFKACMIHELFEGSDEIANALHSQLNDESHIQQILNEGAARGLTQLFASATATLNLSEGDREWLRAKLFTEDDMLPLPAEIQMVGGLLRWIMSGDHSTYATRSALVARVAVCLKSIGYMVGRIQAWDGTGSYPQDLSRKAVLLVLGGSSPTDPLMLDADEIPGTVRTLHYQYKSVGALLLNALENQSDAYPEVLQVHFEFIYQYIETHFLVKYERIETGTINLQAKFHRVPSSVQSTPMARRIAAIYFPFSAEIIAPCYSRIASEEILSQLKEHGSVIGGFDVIPEAVCLFRAVTAAITISIIGRFGGEEFKKGQHSISLSLTHSHWLEAMCKLLDQALFSGLEYNKAVFALAVIHCAQEPDRISECKSAIVAWRKGIYSVVPSLLLSMRPSPDAVGLQCIDGYWANVKVREDGSVYSAPTSSLLQDLNLIEKIENGNGNASSLQSLSQPWIGHAQREPPDVPLYLTIERPLHYSQPDLCFVGRIDGSVIGSTGVLDVLRGLVRNLDEPSDCPGHTSPPSVIYVKASMWAADRRSKPVGENSHTFVPVQGDDCWAIFLVGQSTYFNGRIALRCPECTIERAGSHSVVVGYC